MSKFISEGFEVYGIDNLITGEIGNLDKLMESNDFYFIKSDVYRRFVS
ncbi:hypothetical protein [Methanobacterium spitsbergense]|nr:hypothetical protein [Methanobacterium spitsbergense]